jgi:hypothetical protein
MSDFSSGSSVKEKVENIHQSIKQRAASALPGDYSTGRVWTKAEIEAGLPEEAAAAVAEAAEEFEANVAGEFGADAVGEFGADAEGDIEEKGTIAPESAPEPVSPALAPVAKAEAAGDDESVVMLYSRLTSDPVTTSHTNHVEMVLKAKKVPFEKVDGSDPEVRSISCRCLCSLLILQS